MTENRKKDQSPTDDQFDALLGGIEPRPTPPEEIERAVFEHFLKQTTQLRDDKRKRRRMAYVAMAASIVLALLLQPLMMQLWDTDVSREPAGIIVQTTGEVTVTNKGQIIEFSHDTNSLRLSPGFQLETGINSGLSLDWSSGQENIRIDQQTRLKIISTTQIEVNSGRIYVDAAPGQADDSERGTLEVVTPFGKVKHLGTQYIVAVEDERTDVLVREGRVEIQGNSISHSVNEGTRASVKPSGDIDLSAVKSHGTEWEWVEALSSPYEIDGKRLTEFLEWFQRETGRKIEWATPGLELNANTTILHGSRIEVEPMKALELMLESSGLAWSERDGQILISYSP